VVIPTYNRQVILRRTLEALFGQTYPRSEYEIIVVDDCSSDGTQAMIEQMMESAPVRILYLRQPVNRGQGTARNAGLRMAAGWLVCFLGDDIIPTEGLLQEHVNTHSRHTEDNVVVVGFVTWSPEMQVTPLMHALEKGIQFGFHRAHHGERVDFTYFATSNVSVKRAFLLENGLFDERFVEYGLEDTELAWRLRQKGLVCIYNRNATGYHYHPISLASILRRQQLSGRAAVRFYHKHPEVADWLHIFVRHQAVIKTGKNLIKAVAVNMVTARAMLSIASLFTKPNRWSDLLYVTSLDYYYRAEGQKHFRFLKASRPNTERPCPR
jgi:glycosyltransferase involved in cell wall biosynthesis